MPFDGGDWQVETLLFPSIGNFSPPELAWVRERLAAALPEEAPMPLRTDRPATEPTRIYVSRADATVRRLVNEAEVVATLQPLGFEVLTLTGMPVAEQIARFAEAEIIVGPHGSGLTNLLFAARRAVVIELMPHDNVNHCFWLMANALGQRYTFLSGRVVAPERDFAIAADRLRVVVEAMK